MSAAIVTGLYAGLLTFFRSEAYIVLALTAVVVVWRFPRLFRGRIKETLAMIAVALLVVSPWIVRNYITLDKLVIGSTSGAFNFWRGHNPDATGSSWKPDGNAIWTTDEMYREFDAETKLDPNIEQHYADFHLQRAMEWIADHPAKEALLAVKKPVLLWGIDWYSQKARTPAYILLYCVTVALAASGVARLRTMMASLPIRAFATIAVAWLALYTLIVIAFFTLPRFQVILIGIYFPVVVLGAQRVLARLGLWHAVEDRAAAESLVSVGAL